MKSFFLGLFISLSIVCKAQTSPDGKPLVQLASIYNWDFSQRPAGWYRIASIPGSGLTAALIRGNATFELREDADHSTLRFELGVSYGGGNSGSSFTITSHSYWAAPTFTRIRILTQGTYNDQFVEVYVNPHNNNNSSFNAYLIHPFANGDWNLESWTPGFIPAGYTSTEFDTSQLFTVGNLDNKNILTVSRNGRVGIGSPSPDATLTVNGTIHATEVLVDQAVPHPDYVFDKDYNLASLKDVKTYIDKNHHLPEIPSAAQVAKDGISLGEMNAKLLKKIEELTLYLIEKDQGDKVKDKLLISQQNQINDGQRQIAQLKTQIEDLLSSSNKK
ncbi:hypothetical protein [Mucilaginibacter jinjuensis]|uniref:Uncharacterized protein n=1 Tax=Mucilaginibacter jinjuensis TaxID=1176721 RepID=A0ABY7TCD3_9SPHI|nr:hypothetical protein [Mucilaginibacter jinjuensis]WCT13641.1 hypothetical protein PQO05_06795 [Mucilaginibacter jinjuensis]